MKKCMKRLLSLALAMTMAMSLMVSASAAEPGMEQNHPWDGFEQEGVPVASFSINEYDVYMSTVECTDEELAEMGYQSEDIDTLRTFSIEEALYERAQESVETLTEMGYTREQIILLKSYHGEPLENNSAMRGVFADLEGFLYNMNNELNTAEVKARFYWVWSNSPLVAGPIVKDIMTCAWRGISPSGNDMNMSFDANDSVAYINYYAGVTTNPVRQSIDVRDPQRHAQVKFNMSDTNGNYAKSGYMDIALKRTVSTSSYSAVTFIFGYGHSTITVQPSIEVSGTGPSMSLVFGIGTSEMYNNYVIIHKDGRTEVGAG